MSRPLSVIGGFFLRALLWLGVALGVWFWAREYVVAPVVWMSNGLMQAFFPSGCSAPCAMAQSSLC